MTYPRILAFLLVVLAAMPAAAGELEVVDAPRSSEPPGLDWAAANADAGDRPRFLFFTAGWCGYCHRMEDEVLSDARVREALSGYVCRKIDIDADENRALCRRHQPEGGIPSYVVVDAATENSLRKKEGRRPARFHKSR